MSKITFVVSSRDLKKDKNNQLRAQGMTLGNVYKAGRNSVALKFSVKKFDKLYEEVGDTGLVYLKIDDKKERPTLVDEVQYHPVSDEVLHVSFKEVDLTEKIEAEVPVELVGEFDVKEAVMVQVRNSIVVEALPTDLPEKFEVDISTLTEIGQIISLANLNFDRDKVSLIEVETEEDWSKPVVLVQEQKEEVVEEVATPEAAAADGTEETDKAALAQEADKKADKKEVSSPEAKK